MEVCVCCSMQVKARRDDEGIMSMTVRNVLNYIRDEKYSLSFDVQRRSLSLSLSLVMHCRLLSSVFSLCPDLLLCFAVDLSSRDRHPLSPISLQKSLISFLLIVFVCFAPSVSFSLCFLPFLCFFLNNNFNLWII